MKDYGIRNLWFSVILHLKKIRVIEITRPWHLSSKMLDLIGQVYVILFKLLGRFNSTSLRKQCNGNSSVIFLSSSASKIKDVQCPRRKSLVKIIFIFAFRTR
jgi:hypothetical protein